jgi:protein phosphatase
MDLGTFESVELSDVGRRRQNNEDACLRLPQLGIYCVADGMGGVVGGDLASEAVTNTLQQALFKTPADSLSRLPDRIAMVKAAVNSASKWIRDFANEKVLGQMGTTVVALIFDPRHPSRAVVLHAGDSRLYRFQNRRLEQLTADHTTAAVLAARFRCTEASLPVKVQNELTRAVGLNDNVDLEQTHVRVHSHDLFLLCSDGLTRMLPDEVIARLLADGAQQPMAVLAQALVDGANQAGGKDNITVVLVRVGEVDPSSAAAEDEESETVMACDPPSHEPPTVPGGACPGGSGELDTPITYEGDTPTTNNLTPSHR